MISGALEVASQQLGLITRQQARAHLSDHQIRSLVESGRWERRVHGVYAVGGAPRSYEQTVMAACLAGGARALASHGCAARLLRLAVPHFNRAPPEIVVPRGQSRAARAVGVVVHESRHLDPIDRARVGPIPITRAARLVVDLFSRPDAGDRDVLFALADDVLWRLRDPSEVARTWDRVCRGHRASVLEEVLLPWQPGPRPGSPKEMSLSRILVLHGLPRPVRQFAIAIPGRTHPRYLDLAYPEARVAVEYDGRADHGPRQWASDAAREDELWSVGWLRLIAGRRDLVEPAATELCDAVRRAYGRVGTATTAPVAAAR